MTDELHELIHAMHEAEKWIESVRQIIDKMVAKNKEGKMEILLVKIGLYWGMVLTVIRLIESIYQLSETPEAKTLKDKIVQIFKNFFLSLETYKK